MPSISMKVNEALERYGAKTHGSLERRVERLKRFTEVQNKSYAAQIRLEDARVTAQHECMERMQIRSREIYQEVEIPTLRPRGRDSDAGLKLLLRAIENGHVSVTRG